MRLIRTLILACPFFFASLLYASDDLPISGCTSTVDLLIQRAISANLIAGGVAVIGNHDGILCTTARGTVNGRAGAPSINERTIFDLASLTKVIATTTAVMKLLDEGHICLTDPITRWFPEFVGSGREEITVLNLLTHTSGLADFDLRPWQAMPNAIQKAAAEKNRQRPGSSFNYADINFILLGELVHRVSGKTLDEYCREELFGPLGAYDTMFLPPRNLADNIAPTLGLTSGIVQDQNARRLGGVAGHAGLFSSASDLAKFARLILSGGVIDGRRILSERVVSQMTAPYFYSYGAVVRGLGWDMDSPFSAPKGRLFSETSFGHTGYSGSSIWIDPQRDLFVVLLTIRLNYHDTKMFNQLRRDVSTIAAADFRTPGGDQELAASLEMAKISADLQREPRQALQAPSPRRMLIAQRLKSAAHHKWGKKNARYARRKRYGRGIHRA